MKLAQLILLLLIPFFGHVQPSPDIFYPSRIKELTDSLKKDVDNPNLLWERVVMQVALVGKEREPIEYFGMSEIRTSTINDSILRDLNYLIDSNFVLSNIGTASKINFLYLRGGYYSMTGHYKEALTDFFEVLEIDQQRRFRQVALIGISESYLYASQYDSAHYYCQRLISHERNQEHLSRVDLGRTYDFEIVILKSWGKKFQVKKCYRKRIMRCIFRFPHEDALYYMGKLGDYRRFLRGQRRHKREIRRK